MKSAYPSETEQVVPVLRSSMLSRVPGLVHGVSTRNGGVSPELYGLNLSFNVGDERKRVEENRTRFFRALGIQPEYVAIPRQEHTATIRTITRPGVYEQCDALVTSERGVYCSVTVADCAPIFLYDTMRNVVGCVHAGWRGTQQRILFKTIELMKSDFRSVATDLLAFVGPCAGPCCYEVGREVARQFDESCSFGRDGKIFLDIKRANASQLRAAGIPDSRIEVMEDCTICGADVYHSYRRDREKSGRMMAIIGMSH